MCEHCCQFLVLLNTQGFQVGSNIWLSAWSGDPLASTDIGTRNKYLAVYGVLGLLQSLSIMGATLLCQVLMSKERRTMCCIQFELTKYFELNNIIIGFFVKMMPKWVYMGKIEPTIKHC